VRDEPANRSVRADKRKRSKDESFLTDADQNINKNLKD